MLSSKQTRSHDILVIMTTAKRTELEDDGASQIVAHRANYAQQIVIMST